MIIIDIKCDIIIYIYPFCHFFPVYTVQDFIPALFGPGKMKINIIIQT